MRIVTVYISVLAAFVIPKGTVHVIRDITHDAEVVFDHDKSGAQRDFPRGVDGSFHDDKSDTQQDVKHDDTTSQNLI